MPNRIIKESICVSDTIDKLTWFEEVFFYRLIVNCDDYGRFDARPQVLRSRLFALKDNITIKTVSDALNKLATVGLLRVYECDGRAFLQLLSWDHHQQIRSKTSKFPEPKEKGMISHDIICNQMISDAPVIQSNPIQSESESESVTRACALDERFEQFWQSYPRKTGKEAARKAWSRIKPNKDLFDRILSAVNAAKRCDQWNRNNGQYIPNPATWLNQGRWDDEVPKASTDRSFANSSFDTDEFVQAAIKRAGKMLGDGTK